jgi:GNAT superfamily N-acetyltransferase
MSDFTISRMVIPDTLDVPDAADFIVACALANRVTQDILGSPDFALEPAERLPLTKSPNRTNTAFVARRGDEIIGWGLFDAAKNAAAKECFIEIAIDENHRRSGVGSAILDELIAAARADGKSDLHARVFTRTDPLAPRMEAASGFGSVAANDTGPAFARAHNFTLELVGQINRLALPVDPDVFAERVAVAKTGYVDGYELLHWRGRTPQEHLEGLAALYTAMSTADPHGDLDVTEDVWDADRVLEKDEREAASPRSTLTAAARHVASGELVAFTTLDVPPEADRPVNQWATLVVDAHRGKRLGLAVKLENLRQLMTDLPGHPSVTTINAEENSYMIAVNRSVGFTTVGQGGIFRHILD